MEINEFSDLSDFAVSEAEKISDLTASAGPSKKLLKNMNNQIIRYTKIYLKPLFNSEKRRIKLWQAIDTMPHGFWWKLFHYDLWKKVKAELKSQGELEKYEKTKGNRSEVENQTYYPAIIQESSVPVIYEEDEGEQWKWTEKM